MTSKTNKLIKGSFLRIFCFFVSVISAFYLMPFIIHTLGDKTYGLWIIIGTFISFFWLFDMGVGSSVQRYVSKALSNNDLEDANKTINNTLVIYIFLGIGVLLVTLIAVWIMPVFVKNAGDTALARKLILLLGTSFAIGLPMRSLAGVLSAHLRFDLLAVISLIKEVFRVSMIVIFLKLGYGIWALAWITFCNDLLGHSLTIYLTKKIAPYFILSWKTVEIKKLKEVGVYNLTTFIIQISDKLCGSLDNFIISAFIGLNSVTIFSIAGRFVGFFMQFLNSATGLFVPIFSNYDTKQEYDLLREKYLFVTKVTTYLSCFIGGIFIVYGKVFINRWMGPEYVKSYPILCILTYPMILTMSHASFVQLLFGISKHRIYAFLNMIEGIANITLSLILVQKYGLLGVAFGTAIPMFIIKLFVVPFYISKVIKMKIINFYIHWLKCLAFSFIIFFVFEKIFSGFITSNYSNILSMISVNGLLFAGMVYWLGFNKEEQQILLSVIKNKKD